MENSIAAHKETIDKFVDFAQGENKPDIIAIPEVVPLIPLLLGKQTDLNNAMSIQIVDTKSKTEQELELKKKMAEVLVMYSHKGLPLARAAGNDDLISLLSHEKSYITRAEKNLAVTTCTNIVSAFTSNALIFTNILPADITVMNAVIQAYVSAKTSTSIAMEKRKEQGTEAERTLIKEAFAIMQDIYDYTYGTYALTKPTLVKLMEDAKTVEVEGKRYTGMTVLFIDPTKAENENGHFIEGGTVKLVELNRTGTSRITGMAEIIKVRANTYHVEVSAPGYKTIQTIITLKRGHVLHFEADMVSSASSETSGTLKPQ